MNWIKTLTPLNLWFAIVKAFRLIEISWKSLSKRIFISDFLSVIRSIGFVAILVILSGAAFLYLGQGQDILLLVIERAISGNWWSFAGLLFSMILWSIFAELSVRYAIAVSDNSGLHLSDERVEWRKTVQKLLAAFFLLWPICMVLIGLIWVLVKAEYISYSQRITFGGIAIFSLLLVLLVLAELYFRKFGKGTPGNPKLTKLGHRSLPPLERKWLEKLYGIYNDYVFTLPKHTNFKGIYNEELKDFTNLFLDHNYPKPGFPQDPKVLQPRRLVPDTFILLNAQKIKNSAALYKWVYKIPPSFYAIFHKRVRRMIFISIFLFIMIALIPAKWNFYAEFGAPALVCLAFACYTGMYIGLLYIDKVFLPKWPLGIRFVLIVWVACMSWLDNDHPVRLLGDVQKRNDVQTQFKKWFTAYKQSFDSLSVKKPDTYPVVFICAEGGAFRTGAYTAMFLSQMESDLTKRSIDFRQSIFAMSGVSGGAVGLGFYNAMAFRDKSAVADTALVAKTREFFLHDSLSPIIGKMFYGEFINLFSWRNIELFDRSIALEDTWEKAYSKFKNNKKTNSYSEPFILNDTGTVKPVFLINTFEAESGLNAVVSNNATNGLLFDKQRDLFASKLKNIRYSTAINFSSRFPLFSPGAMIDSGGKKRLHYLDGGYVENTGTGSMLEIIQLLKQSADYKCITPIVISLRFGTDSTDNNGIKFLNELSEIASGLLNTRSGRSKTAVAMLKKVIEADKGIWIDAPLNPEEKKIPMNWVLSSQSMNRIQKDIHEKLAPKGKIMDSLFSRKLIYKPMPK
ncbi:patatin-like phospholipase family protein [Pedobacter montanisoli]|uniref:PNPLA domain-containing protein n=1 Tax=Pedobacter montanisoli TaxID=2923277 RepID=A0ABS9ZYN7_9SPHI|nr:patatin-like phospholipase family protein [Pedobacter montanisoli]MCJ0743416.1 hypothetical protein [Pedobacter montanisoli]